MAKLVESYFVRALTSFITVIIAQLLLLEIVYGLINLFSPDSQVFKLLPLSQVGFMYILVFAGKVNVINLIFVVVWSALLVVIVFLRISTPRESSINSLFINRLLWPVVGVLTFIQLPFSQSFTPVIAACCFVALARYLPLPIRFGNQ